MAGGRSGAVIHGREREARLYLVGSEPRLLLLELLHRDLRQVSALALLGGGEAHLQRCDALAQARDARGELAVVLRHVVTCALHSYPAALRLMQRQSEILETAVLLPHSRSKGLIQVVIHYAL